MLTCIWAAFLHSDFYEHATDAQHTMILIMTQWGSTECVFASVSQHTS
jgi:hypothetical protein